MPVAMKHWPHILKFVVYLFSPSNSLEIKGQRKNEMIYQYLTDA